MPDRNLRSMNNEAYTAATAAFSELNLPRKVTFESLLAVMEERRGRKILLVEAPELLGTSACGVWFPCKSADMVFYPPVEWKVLKEQYVLHEFAHMILEHDSVPGGGNFVESAVQHIPRHLVQRALFRTDFRTFREATAEYLADLLATAIRDSPTQPGGFEGVFG